MKLYLLIFLVVYFALVFIIPTYIVYKKTGINPITFGKDDNAHNYVGKILKILIFALFVVIIINFLNQGFYEKYFISIKYIINETIFYLGFILLHLSLIWIIIAQFQMGNNWKIGIDEKHKTELVTKGVFSISRNPVFLGMIVTLFSVFLILPNILTFFIAFTGFIVIQIQIRLEEEFLLKEFGQKYLNYKNKTRRLI